MLTLPRLLLQKTLGDPAQFQAIIVEKLGQHFTSEIRATTAERAQQVDAKRKKRCGPLELGKNEIMEVEAADMPLP